MPTGYTSVLYDGEQSFEDFVMRTSRGMMALVTMRDEPLDAPIPERFKPYTEYSDKRLAEAQSLLRRLDGMTPAQAQEAADAEFSEAEEKWQESEQTRLARRERYEAMLAQVEAWEPPTAEHVSFKDYMRDQLKQSIDFDTSSYSFDSQRLTAQEWVEEKRRSAERDVEYHTGERAKEIERAQGRTAWVQALRASLAGDTASV